jgi:hypothetical protein
LAFGPQLTREYFTKELKRHYQGYNNTDVFTSTWNGIMNTVRPLFICVSLCGSGCLIKF